MRKKTLGTTIILRPFNDAHSGRPMRLGLQLQSVQYDLQDDFVRVTDEADRSAVLVLLRVAFLGKCDNQGLGPRV